MKPSRGMGVISPRKSPRLKRRGDDKPVPVFSAGGLYANIHAKRERIAAGSGEKMRKPGSKGAPTSKAFAQSAKTARK
jgi:hypothetical protein